MKPRIIGAGPESPASLEDPRRWASQNGAASNGHGHSHEPRVFASRDHEVNLESLAVLAEGVKSADLVTAPVVLPDFYHKHNMEMPSSIAVATRDSIRPTLTSASINCGMALIAFDSGKPSVEQITRFYDRVRTSHPFPPSSRRDLTFDEVVRCAVEGAEFAVDRWNLEPEALLSIEEGGRLDLGTLGGEQRVREEVPWLVLQLSRMRFGTIGPSNHFVELQEVEKVLEPAIATRLGVREGQIVLQFHAGGGVLTGAIGAMYGRRRGGNGLLKNIMAAQKPIHHLAGARTLGELRDRYALYFAKDCPPVPRHSPEGDRLIVSNAVAMNYGFAFRLRTYAALREMAADCFGSGSRLVVDSPHNSIYEEDVEGELAVVHRHNAVRAYPASRMAAHPIFRETGQPLLVPGTNRTCSYLCVASDGAQAALYSACHGTGSIIDDFAKRGLSGPDPDGSTTLRFDYKQPEPRVVPHLDNRGVDEGISILVQHDIARPVARLRPFAVLN